MSGCIGQPDIPTACQAAHIQLHVGVVGVGVQLGVKAHLFHLFQRIGGEVGEVEGAHGFELVFLHVHRDGHGQLLAVDRLPHKGKLCIGHRFAGGVGVVVHAHVQPGSPGVAVVGLKGRVDVQPVCPLGKLAVGGYRLEHCPLVARRCHLRPVDKALIPARVDVPVGRLTRPARHGVHSGHVRCRGIGVRLLCLVFGGIGEDRQQF